MAPKAIAVSGLMMATLYFGAAKYYQLGVSTEQKQAVCAMNDDASYNDGLKPEDVKADCQKRAENLYDIVMVMGIIFLFLTDNLVQTRVQQISDQNSRRLKP